MGKKGKKAQAGKPKKLTPKDIGKRIDALAKRLEEELEGADLFAPFPPAEDCAICFVPLPHLKPETCYQACCGNSICKACYIENRESINKQNEEKNAGKKLAVTCPFCREPVPASGEEFLRRLQARCLQNDHYAFTLMGNYYRGKDDLKALNYWVQAVELGSAVACVDIGNVYDQGNGVAVDKKRGALFERIGALRGCIYARHNIGLSEYHTFGNRENAMRHWKIAAEAGDQDSLNILRKIYNAAGKEFISKEYLESSYRACHEAQMEVKTEEREKHSGRSHI